MADVRMQASPKLPPYSAESEQSVLGGLMLDNRRFAAVSEFLRADHFYRQDHQLIFAAIGEMIGRNQPCDLVTLVEFLRVNGKLEEVGGIAYVGSLARDTPSAANVVPYATIVHERAILRQLIAAGGDIAELGFRPEGRPPGELLDIAERAILEVRKDRGADDSAARPVAQVLDLVTAKIDRLSKGLEPPGLSTGLKVLDDRLTGLHAGELVIIAGRPGSGKTACCIGIAEHVAIYGGKSVAVFSLEMPAEQLLQRSLGSLARIDGNSLRTGQLTQHEWAKLALSEGTLRNAPIHIDDTSGVTVDQIRARARRLHRKHNLSLIVIDYLQLIEMPRNAENRTNAVSEISAGLKKLARELGIPVIALSQLNRGLESRPNKRPQLHDLRESGGIEQDADVVIGIYRDELYNADSADKGIAELITLKQRNGPIGSDKVAFLSQYTRFENLAYSNP